MAFSHLLMPVSDAVIFEIRMVADIGDEAGMKQGREILRTVRKAK